MKQTSTPCWSSENMGFSWILLVWTACAAISPSVYAREVVDMMGTKVSLSQKPMRIVTLVPSLGELAADILGSEEMGRIVGVSEYTDYPPALGRVKRVGNYTQLSLEGIVSLQPDLVLATHDGNAKDQINHLRELKIPVIVVNTETFEDIEKSVRLVASALGVEKEGDRMALQLHSGISHIRELSAKLTKVRVILQLGGDPLVVVGKRTFLHEALEAVGGMNVYADSQASYPRPAIEDAVARNAEVIVVLVLGTDIAPFRKMAADWNQFPSMSAAKNKRVKLLRADQLLRPTMRLLEGLELLKKAIHQEASL